MATKTTRNYFKIVASDYLKNMLSPLIIETISYPKGYEVDPLKLPPNEDINENRNRLVTAVSHYLDTIINSLDDMPL
jgi:hypothetical protein